MMFGTSWTLLPLAVQILWSTGTVTPTHPSGIAFSAVMLLALSGLGIWARESSALIGLAESSPRDNTP